MFGALAALYNPVVPFGAGSMAPANVVSITIFYIAGKMGELRTNLARYFYRRKTCVIGAERV